MAPFLLDATSWEGAQIQLFRDTSEALTGTPDENFATLSTAALEGAQSQALESASNTSKGAQAQTLKVTFKKGAGTQS